MTRYLHQRYLLILATTLSMFTTMLAQNPNGYYSKARNQKGKALKTALFQIVSNHTQRSYKQLWEDFKSTDVRSDGKVWDMYSNVTNYEPGGSKQGANYSKEGDSYNREHSFPKSWFDDGYPMYTDLFHLYPTDGYVNNRRSNYPFGENNGEIYKSANSFSKLGKSTLSGYSGTVFEPADEYKGDFARTYFYMATAYEDKIASWSSPMLSGNSYSAYSDWAMTMLLRWAEEDPVSEKEIERNNAVYKIQNNRNPFIDYPGLEQYIWGSHTSTPFDPDNYFSPDTPQLVVPAPAFSLPSGTVESGTVVTLSCDSVNASIVYTVNDSERQTAKSPIELTITETSTISAYAVLNGKTSETVTATYRIGTAPEVGEGNFVLLTDQSQLSSNMEILIVCRRSLTAMSAQGSDIRHYVELEEAENTITTSVNRNDLPYAFLLNRVNSYWTIKDMVENTYLALNSDGNKIHNATTSDNKNAQWSIDISSNGTAHITNTAYTNRLIQYNPSAPRFACYKGTQYDVSIYGRTLDTAIDYVRCSHENAHDIIVYRIDGTIATKGKNLSEILNNLPIGTYIVNGKVIVR